MHKPRHFYHIKFSKTPKKLPEVLTKEETIQVLSSIKNPKHKLMIILMYSSGLRVSELVNLKLKDLQLEKNFGWVRGGKGNKDRLFIIAKKLKKELTDYIKENNINDWLFPGQKNYHISTQSIYLIVKHAAKKAKIQKRVHPHTMRHSFSTHLVENGYDVASIQYLLGHKSPETTMIYLHMASPKMINVESPYDDLHSEVNTKNPFTEHKNPTADKPKPKNLKT